MPVVSKVHNNSNVIYAGSFMKMLNYKTINILIIFIFECFDNQEMIYAMKGLSDNEDDGQILESKEERFIQDLDCDDGKTIYDQYLKRLLPQIYGAKITAILIHFGSYAVESIHHANQGMEPPISDEDDDERQRLFLSSPQGPLSFRQKGRSHQSTADLFAAMYSHYVLILSTLSLETCFIYYKEEGSDVANECQRLLEYLLWFQCIYPFHEIYRFKPLSKQPKNTKSMYNIGQIISKLINIQERLDDILNQDFTPVLRESRPEPLETFEKDYSENHTVVDLQLLYNNVWKALLEPLKEDILALHNYFNDAMNINYFASDINKMVGLPYSRVGMTDVWKELAHENSKAAGKSAVQMVFYILRTLEVGRTAIIMEAHKNIKIGFALSSYSLVNINLRQGIADFVIIL